MSKEPEFVLALDVSTSTIGIALFEDMGDHGELKLLHHVSPKVKPQPSSKMEELFKAIGTYGLSPWMIFIIIIIFIVSKFYQKQIVGFFKNLFKGYTRSYKIKELVNHDIFNTCERVKKEIKFEKFYTHGEFDATKTRMCQDFTNFKTDVCSKNFKVLININ